jgi:hypothetical protein
MTLPGEWRPVVHRESPFIRRISREHPQVLAQDSATDLTTTCETHMNTLSSKLTAFAAALLMNSLIMTALGYLFTLQSHPQMSAFSFATAFATHQWFI